MIVGALIFPLITYGALVGILLVLPSFLLMIWLSAPLIIISSSRRRSNTRSNTTFLNSAGTMI